MQGSFPAILILSGCFLSSSAPAQQVGDRVVVITKAQLQIGPKVVDTVYPGTILVVRKVQEDWLSVSQGTPGWIHQDDVLLLGPAVDFFSAIIRKDPKDVAAYFIRGNIRSEQGEFTKAVADYSKAIELDPKDGPAYNGRGHAYRSLGQPDKALADFNMALQLDAKDTWAYNNRGILFFEKGENDKAIADFDQAIRLRPKHAWAYHNRGNAWAAKGNLDKALADYDEAIRLDPKDGELYGNRGLAYQAGGDYARALEDFDKAIQLEPNQPAPLNHLAWLLATCPESKYRDGKRALAAANQICGMSAWKNPVFLNILAAAHAEVSDFDAAVRWQARALELASKEDRADYQKRLELYRAGKPYRLKKNK